MQGPQKKLLLIDDNPAIHGDFKKIFIKKVMSEIEKAA